MRLAITGGAGFLGYNLCRLLAAKFDGIVVLDIVPINPQEYPKNVEYIRADVRDKKLLEEALKGSDLVIHAAAAMPIESETQNFDVNVNGTKCVLEAALMHAVKRVVHISTTYVYGAPLRNPIVEEDPLCGLDPYGKSKIEAEKVCLFYRSKGMCIPIVRAKTFIGACRLGVFAILYDWIKSGKNIPVIGNGKNCYQLLEVEDLVDAVYLLLTAPPEKVNDTFNVASDRFGTVLEDVGELIRFAGTGASVIRTPAKAVKCILSFFEMLKISPLYKTLYETADKDCYVSVEKIKKRLDWSPKYSNAEALIKCYQWYLEHCDELETGVSNRSKWKQGILALLKYVF